MYMYSTTEGLLTAHPLSSLSEREMAELRDAYYEAFPLEERRPWRQIVAQRPCGLEFVALRRDQILVGFTTLWSFVDFLFVEHLLIYSTYRGMGTGAEAIALAKRRAGARPLVLEAEPAACGDLACRRLAFYARLGIEVQPYTYLQPPYVPGLQPVALHLLSSMPLEPDRYARIRQSLYREVYGYST